MNMKIRNAILMTAVASVALIAAFCPKPTPAEKEAVLLQKMMEVMNQLHYNPQANNDELSKKVFKLYLDRSDAGRRFLTQSDVDKMNAYELQLDDQIKAQDFTFFNKSVELMDAATVKAETFYKEVLTETDWAKHLNFDDLEELRKEVVKDLVNSEKSFLDIKKKYLS